MYELTTGEYKVVFELYFLSASIDHSSVDISSTSSVETISRVSSVWKGFRVRVRVRVWDQELLSELVDQTFIIYNPRHQ